MKDRLGVAALLTGRFVRRIRRTLASPGRAAVNLRIKVPERLLIAPQDIRTADPTIAADIVAGYFAFGGKIVNARGRSPFARDAGSDVNAAWSRQLAGFGWLRHLRAADGPLARQRARALVGDFMAASPRPSPSAAWDPPIAARRMLAWLSQSPVILDGADRPFYTRFMRALSVHRAHLDRLLADGLAGEDRLLVALALAEFALCAQGAGASQKRATQILAGEIDMQVLPDGGPVSRNPQVTIDLLLDLLPLRQAYAARGVPTPQQVLNAIDRMMPMLRLFRHGDRTLALFNGMGVTAPELTATILAYDDARAQPLANARYAGYQRMEAGASLVIVDAGGPPPQAFSARAHAGSLSFELSSGIRRIVVNCGAPDDGRTEAREAARTTAAHSTLVIDDTSSCRFAAGTGLRRWLGDQILSGPQAVAVERTEGSGGTRLDLSHDGYGEAFGLVHHRTLQLSEEGAALDGLDRLSAVPGRPGVAAPYALRFHLHPSVRARQVDDGRAIALDVSDNEVWLFEADAPTTLDTSVLFAATGGPRPTTQIKVVGDSGAQAEMRWRFRRLTAG